MAVPTFDVAVIGAGATGSALAVQLARLMPAGGRVLLVGAPGATARGVAYGTGVDDHLLNVRAGRMSLVADDPRHFVRWLAGTDAWRATPEDAIADSYVPRRAYGRYVLETLHQEIIDAAGRVSVRIVESAATEIVEQDGQYIVTTESGARYAARYAALCLGHGRPEFPLSADAVDPEARERMIADPWSDPRIGSIGVEDRVLLVGTGLTMVDQLLTLDALGHRGPLTALSRRGFVPNSHCPQRSEPVPVDLPEGPVTLRGLTRAVVAAARGRARSGEDWRSVVDGLRPVTVDLWQGLDHADRRRFCRHLESLWSVVRHRMAPLVAARVEAARAGGRLDICAGRIVTVKRTRHGVTVAIRARGSRTVRLAGFDWMINCSGTGRVPVNAVEPPLARLVAQGLARPDRLGRGVDVTADGQAVGRSGQPTRGLFALGPMGAGALLEITAIPDIREQCAAAAGRIAGGRVRDRGALAGDTPRVIAARS